MEGTMKSLVAGRVLLTGAGAAAVWWSSRRRRGEDARLVVTVNRPVSDVRFPMLLDRMAKGELRTDHLITHLPPLEKAPHGYDLFKYKKDGCVRAVFQPGG
jgi:threonine dehydrogenase-like Zn-dependent dehydrogenase